MSFRWMRACPWCRQTLKKEDPYLPWKCPCGWSTEAATPGRALTEQDAITRSILGVVFVVMLSACGSLSATSVPHDVRAGALAPLVMDVRAIVVGSHQGSVNHVTKELQDRGFTILQRDPLHDLLNTRVRLSAAESQIDALHAGYQSGAEVVIFVEVSGSPGYPTAIVKGLEVETGDILWSGGVVYTGEVAETTYETVILEVSRRALLDGLSKPQRGSTAVLSSYP